MTPQTAREFITGSAARVVRASTLYGDDVRVVLEDAEGRQFEVDLRVLSGLRAVEEAVQPVPRTPRELERLYQSRRRWPQADLRAGELPMYWSASWLRAALTEHRSLEEITAKTGYSADVLKRWRRRHKIKGNPRHEAIRAAWRSGKYRTRGALAQAWGISESTVSQIIGKRRREDPAQEDFADEVRRAMLAGHTRPAALYAALNLTTPADQARAYRVLRRLLAEGADHAERFAAD